MKKVFSLILVAALLSSCGIFRDVRKDKFEHDISVKGKTDSTETIGTRSLDRGSTVESDQGVVVTEEETTTKTKKPGANVELSADMLRLKNGETISKDSAGVKVSVMLDSLSNKLKISVTGPAEESETTTTKRTTENKNRSKEDQRDKEESSNKQVAVSNSNERKESTETKNVDKRGTNSFWFMVMALGALFIVGWLVSRWFKK